MKIIVTEFRKTNAFIPIILPYCLFNFLKHKTFLLSLLWRIREIFLSFCSSSVRRKKNSMPISEILVERRVQKVCAILRKKLTKLTFFGRVCENFIIKTCLGRGRIF